MTPKMQMLQEGKMRTLKDSKISKKCNYCGGDFRVYPSLKRIKFCSYSCYWKSMIGKKRPDNEKIKISNTMKRKGLKGPIRYGKDCNFWKGGVNKINKSVSRLIRDSKEYEDWRKAVMERDDFTCQKCGERGGKLNADHYPFSFSVLLGTVKGITKDFVERGDLKVLSFFWDVENGRTLCKDCHRKFGNKTHLKYHNLFEQVDDQAKNTKRQSLLLP